MGAVIQRSSCKAPVHAGHQSAGSKHQLLTSSKPPRQDASAASPTKTDMAALCSILRPANEERHMQLQPMVLDRIPRINQPSQHQVDFAILQQLLSKVGQPHLPALQHLAELGFCTDRDKEHCVNARIAQLQCFDEGDLHTNQLCLVVALHQICRLASCWPA